MEAYLDNSATTRCSARAKDLMVRILTEDYGNPSSLHNKGKEAEDYIRTAREQIARTLKIDGRELVFTSGGTESNNMALIGGTLANRRNGRHIITTGIEHASVLAPLDYLKELGYEITYLSVDENGQISLDELREAVREDTVLVSIMMVNNEIGALEPVEAAAKLIKEKNPGTLFHVDAVQGYGKSRIYVKRMKIDMLSVSAHKIHGPKGTGFLYVGDKVKIRPVVFGGGQERGLRSGTENVPAIAGMARAAEEIYRNLDEDAERMYELRARLEEGIMRLENVRFNTLPGRESAPHVLSVSFAGVRSEVLLHALEDKGIYVSAGSACASNHPETSGSATLRAIGLEKELLNSTIRFSLSPFTTEEEINYTVQALEELVPMLRRYTRR